MINQPQLCESVCAYHYLEDHSITNQSQVHSIRVNINACLSPITHHQDTQTQHFGVHAD